MPPSYYVIMVRLEKFVTARTLSSKFQPSFKQIGVRITSCTNAQKIIKLHLSAIFTVTSHATYCKKKKKTL